MKSEIFNVLDSYSRHHDLEDSTAGLEFYGYLSSYREDLMPLAYQDVHAWLIEYRNVVHLSA